MFSFSKIKHIIFQQQILIILVGDVCIMSHWQGLSFSDMSCLCRHFAKMSDLLARHVADIWCSRVVKQHVKCHVANIFVTCLDIFMT